MDFRTTQYFACNTQLSEPFNCFVSRMVYMYLKVAAAPGCTLHELRLFQ
jgi:hypothetical protein